ncbi:MAG: prepilin-type N-terminal cleavage/methylation domain-containing protein [Actinobacteria bacterium]|nr:prepilin-type N-terminal cleavage/methylation domain-containing protein [Actinomycetota bacterium]
MNGYSKIKGRSADSRLERDDDQGFTLVEILIAIVLVGILSAVVVVGIGNLTSKGSSTACAASLDAAKSGAVVYYTTTNAYPLTLAAMTVPTTSPAAPAALTLPSGVTVNAAAITGPPAVAIGMQASSGGNWLLTMTPGVAGAAPTFVCS